MTSFITERCEADRQIMLGYFFYCVGTLLLELGGHHVLVLYTCSSVRHINRITYHLPYFSIMYFRLNFSISHKFTFTIWVIFCCTAIIGCLMQVFAIIDFPDIIDLSNYLLVLFFLPMIIIAIIEFKRGNQLLRFLSPNLLIMLTGVIGAMLAYFRFIKGIPFYLASVFNFRTI